MKIPREACAYGDLGKPVATSCCDERDDVRDLYRLEYRSLVRRADDLLITDLHRISIKVSCSTNGIYIYRLSLRNAQELLSRFFAHVMPTDSSTSER